MSGYELVEDRATVELVGAPEAQVAIITLGPDQVVLVDAGIAPEVVEVVTPGPQGASGNVFFDDFVSVEVISTGSDQMVIPLPSEPGGMYFLFRNGGRQARRCYQVSGAQVTIAAGVLGEGDEVAFDYLPKD